MFNRCISILCTVIAVLALSSRISAQELNEDDRNRYVTQIRAYKHGYLVKELNLSKEQQDAFFELYDSMEDRIMDLGTDMRSAERKALSEDATPEEIEAAASAIYSQKLREGEIEFEYYEKFKGTLTPRQLILLRQAERKFNQELMRQHRRIRGERKLKR